MKKQNQNRGITLIALVVTVVVLIILATISINTVFGENGLIKQAQRAKELQEQKEREELDELNGLSEYVGDYLNRVEDEMTQKPELPDITENTEAGTEVKKPNGWSDKVIAIADGKGTEVPLPDKFYYVDGNYDTGLVISDKQDDKINSSGIDMGNQFVWIPVQNEETFIRINFDSNGKPTVNTPSVGQNVTDCIEPYASGYQEEAEEYNIMKTQVLKYGGFYIGRYEAGVNSTALRTEVTVEQEVVSKKGVAPYNYISWGQSMNDIGTLSEQSGAVYLAKNMYRNSESVTSTLVYGSQWDAMCRYIGDSQRTTSTKATPELTGSVDTDVSKNIYDLAGNCGEWTMEASNSISRVIRGGRYSNVYPISYRYGYSPTDYYASFTFRCGLYIK